MRLTKTDVTELKEKGWVKEETVFNFEAVFAYALIVDETSEEINVKYKDHCITVSLPEKDAATLTATEETTLKNSQYNGKNEGLLIVVEKDLTCVDATSEDQNDTYDDIKSSC